MNADLLYKELREILAKVPLSKLSEISMIRKETLYHYATGKKKADKRTAKKLLVLGRQFQNGTLKGTDLSGF